MGGNEPVLIGTRVGRLSREMLTLMDSGDAVINSVSTEESLKLDPCHVDRAEHNIR